MRNTRSYYEILGVPRDAPAALIKRKYRILVRKYHPDVAQDKASAHKRFIEISEAYEVLSDPTRRRSYDEGLDLQARRDAEKSAAYAATAPKRSAQPSGPADVQRMIKEAQWAFIQRKFATAAEILKEALQIDGVNPTIYAMLGDIYRSQGKVNSAVKYYSFALQYNSRDRETEKKLTDLIGNRLKERKSQPTSDLGKTLNLSIMWWAVAFFLVMLISVYPGRPIPWLHYYIPRVALWSWNMVGLMAGAAAVVGGVLSATGLLSNPDEELVFGNTGAHWSLIPAGFLLLVGSGFFFLGAAAFYILVSLLQGELSRSMIIVFCGVVGVVLFSALMYVPEARLSVMMYGGNIAFFSCLIGWYAGAMMRPLSD